jgi:hypothetical protein
MSSDEFIPTLTHATERDIDLILVEELYSSPAFVGWMAAQAGLEHKLAASNVLHSKRRTRSRREIDIFVEIHDPDGSGAALLVENKLDANEQPDQAESYREELDRVAGDYARAAMVIICPAEYNRRHREFTAKFDAVITYERLSGYFAQGVRELTGEAAARMRFRRDVLEQAIHKHRRGYTPVPNDVVGDFKARYGALLADVAPEIVPGKSMLRPANPDESTSMIFDHSATFAAFPPELRPTRFAHELGRGRETRANYVAITFGGWGRAIDSLKDRIRTDAASRDPNVFAMSPTKVRPNPGLVVAIPTPPVDNQGDFQTQTDAIVEGMGRAVELRNWLLRNAEEVRAWSSLVDRPSGV